MMMVLEIFLPTTTRGLGALKMMMMMLLMIFSTPVATLVLCGLKLHQLA
jgi:hypothetical protein